MTTHEQTQLPPRVAQHAPLMATTLTACVLAVAAGTVDGFSFFSAKTFSSVQSGNLVQMGYWIAQGDTAKLVDVGLAVIAFALGANSMAAAGVVARRRGAIVSRHVLFAEAAILFVVSLPFVDGGLSVLAVAYVLAFAAGMQGTAFHKVDGMVVGNVAVTLNVQLAASYVVAGLLGQGREAYRKSGIYAVVLLAFAGGALLGGVGANHLDAYVLWFPAALLATLGSATLLEAGRRPIDPRP